GKTTNMKTYMLIVPVVCTIITTAWAAALATAKVDQITGLKGKMNETEGAYTVTFPSNDVKVLVDGWSLRRCMGLGDWPTFMPTKDGAVVMGDTVLFEDEVNTAMSAATTTPL